MNTIAINSERCLWRRGYYAAPFNGYVVWKNISRPGVDSFCASMEQLINNKTVNKI